jgi:hypothetical protein
VTTAIGLLAAALALVGLVGAWTNRNPWDLLQQLLNPRQTVRPIQT